MKFLDRSVISLYIFVYLSNIYSFFQTNHGQRCTWQAETSILAQTLSNDLATCMNQYDTVNLTSSTNMYKIICENESSTLLSLEEMVIFLRLLAYSDESIEDIAKATRSALAGKTKRKLVEMNDRYNMLRQRESRPSVTTISEVLYESKDERDNKARLGANDRPLDGHRLLGISNEMYNSLFHDYKHYGDIHQVFTTDLKATINITFIGDSVMRHQYVHLCCILDPNITTTRLIQESEEIYSDPETHGFLARHFYTVIIGRVRLTYYIWGKYYNRSPSAVKGVLSRYLSHTLEYAGKNDVVMVNYGLHFNPNTINHHEEGAVALTQYIASLYKKHLSNVS